LPSFPGQLSILGVVTDDFAIPNVTDAAGGSLENRLRLVDIGVAHDE
jgi:hypothetical protein